MLTLADVEATLKQLAHERPVFHSEADFQHAFAWGLRERFPDLRVRLEYPLPSESGGAYADIWLPTPEGPVVLELKYWTRETRVTWADEEFSLRDQSANDIRRYDFLKDVSRVERLVADKRARAGAVIAITNDHLYWQEGRPNTVDAEFRIHEGRRLSGTMRWSDAASAGTTQSREAPITLRGEYLPAWRPYSTVPGGPYGEFRYLFHTVE
ncbi:MAG: hypothetical protein OXG38_01615 [Chloroflexi bacterium]|nr:hypothetical protein [Chloroflexota bacterium]